MDHKDKTYESAAVIFWGLDKMASRLRNAGTQWRLDGEPAFFSWSKSDALAEGLGVIQEYSVSTCLRVHDSFASR